MLKPSLTSVGLLLLAVATPAAAQVTGAPLDADDRAREFRRLARDVEQLEAQLGVFKRVVRLVSPSVVHIEANPVQEYRLRQSPEAGSGVIVRFRGDLYVLTNRHVIRHSSKQYIRVQLADGRHFKPQRVWSDADTDVAVMAISADEEIEFVPAVLGDSADLEIGEQVLAFGSPFGLSHSVTRGIVSAKGRHNLDLGDGEVKLQDFLQTDAAINPGNSGGPLVNLRGEVIGLNTAIASSSGGNEGIGFSIPIDLATRVAGQLIENGQPLRGYLGVSYNDFQTEGRARAAGLSRRFGTRVTNVVDGSPAARAALRVNDILLRYDGVAIEDGDHLHNLVNLTESGRQVEIEVLRNGARVRAIVPIGRRPSE